jgi:2-hydroxy-3-keto-5-methylthiopentenyl-1-phosphate phosphatase
MKTKKKIALISDFDGTISVDDFFWYAIKDYLDENSLQPWNDYLDKKITHFEALSKIFGQIRAEKEDFDNFIDKFPIEEKFVDTLALLRQLNKVDLPTFGKPTIPHFIYKVQNLRFKVQSFSEPII